MPKVNAGLTIKKIYTKGDALNTYPTPVNLSQDAVSKIALGRTTEKGCVSPTTALNGIFLDVRKITHEAGRIIALTKTSITSIAGPTTQPIKNHTTPEG
jgi:hypothetical protein